MDFLTTAPACTIHYYTSYLHIPHIQYTCQTLRKLLFKIHTLREHSNRFMPRKFWLKFLERACSPQKPHHIHRERRATLRLAQHLPKAFAHSHILTKVHSKYAYISCVVLCCWIWKANCKHYANRIIIIIMKLNFTKLRRRDAAMRWVGVDGWGRRYGVGYNINNAALLYGLSDIWLSGWPKCQRYVVVYWMSMWIVCECVW